MGILRIYLALCVVAAHSGDTLFPWIMHSGREAVQIFFIISGFYMALIQSKYSSVFHFYISRFIRILIPYWVIVLAILIASVITGITIKDWGVIQPYLYYSPEINGLAGLLLSALSNITVFFQDWVMFLVHEPGEKIHFTTNLRDEVYPLWRYLIIPQAWSVGVELSFYLFVPFLGRLRNIQLFLILLLSILLRIFSYEVLGLENNPWNYRFFPFELALFIAGMLSYRLYAQCRDEVRPLKKITSYINNHSMNITRSYFMLIPSYLGIFFIVKKHLAPVFSDLAAGRYAILLSYLVWLILIPILFELTKSNKWDRLIGELSYPTYLVHYFIIGRLIRHEMVPISWHAEVAVFSSLIIAFILLKLIIFPLDNWRYSFSKKATSCLINKKQLNV